MKKLIFDKLFEKNICFAVCVAENWWVQGKRFVDELSRDYFIIVAEHDMVNAEGNPKGGFTFNHCKSHLLERELTKAEIIEFKGIMDKFIKVKHNKDGRVYELKDESFKDHYKSLK
jgi:hypothetical protein